MNTTRNVSLAIDAMPVAPGGGLTVLLGYLEAWRAIEAPLDITIYTWRQATIDALGKAGFADRLADVPVSNRRAALVWERTKLPQVLNASDANVVWVSNLMLAGVRAPQVVFHQTLFSLSEASWLGYARKGLRRVLQHAGARKALRHAPCNVFISQYLRDCAEVIVPSSRSRNRVIHNGVAQTWLERARTGQSRTNDSRTICTISAPSPHKDNESVLQTIVGLRRAQPDAGWRLVVAGPSDWSEWQARAAELGISDIVEFVGFLTLDEVATLYQQSLCTIFPSKFEAFGLPIIEAMACGCPVVAIDRTAMPEVGGDAALLVKPGAVDDMIAAVLQLAGDTDRYRGRVAACYRQALRFSWFGSAEAMMQVFWDVVGNDSPRA